MVFMFLVINIYMGFLDFIKKVLDSSAKVEEEKIAEKVKSKDIKNWVQNKKKVIAEDEKVFLKQINTRTSQLADELEKEVTALRAVNLDKLKAEKHAKLITKTNLNKYAEHLSELTETLRSLNITTSDNILENITLIFRNFEQKSIKNFQKASFLVGHELSDIGVSTGKFFKDIRQTIKDNMSIINSSKIICSVELKLKEIDDFEKTKLKFKSNIDNFEQKVTEFKDEKNQLTKDIETVKTSKSYIKELKKCEDLENDKTELKKNIYKLKNLIDFKLLANTFHSNPKQMAIVKDYKTNFEEAFQSDSSNILINLLTEAKVNHGSILDNINNIIKTQQKIENTILDEDRIANLNMDIHSIQLQIEDINSKKELEQKKYNKFQTNHAAMLDAISDKLSKINVLVE
jgi:hypothetical protein